jgi:hypothetical protein
MTDHAAFLDATLPHLDVVWNVARRMAANPALAEDLVQETYLRAFRSYDSKSTGEMRSWLVALHERGPLRVSPQPVPPTGGTAGRPAAGPGRWRH